MDLSQWVKAVIGTLGNVFQINGQKFPEPSTAYNLLREGHDGHLPLSSKDSLKALKQYFTRETSCLKDICRWTQISATITSVNGYRHAVELIQESEGTAKAPMLNIPTAAYQVLNCPDRCGSSRLPSPEWFILGQTS
jgi:hypothetical protein